MASLVFGAGGLGHEAGGLRPPPASPAPIGLVCPHGEEEGSALVLGIGLRLLAVGIEVFLLSLSYISP
jgi:hypothetical protein